MGALTLEQLSAALSTHDLPLLRTLYHAASPTMKPAVLVAVLAEQPDGRLGEMLVALFLRHPEYARYVPELVQQLPAPAARRLQHLYTAAVYLQHLWRGSLRLYLGDMATLPDYFGVDVWKLPDPTIHYGESGLRDLAEQMTAETGDNWLNSYQNALSLLLTHLRQEADYVA